MERFYYLIKKTRNSALLADGICWRHHGERNAVWFRVQASGEMDLQFEDLYEHDPTNNTSTTYADIYTLGNVISSYLMYVNEVKVFVERERPTSFALYVG